MVFVFPNITHSVRKKLHDLRRPETFPPLGAPFPCIIAAAGLDTVGCGPFSVDADKCGVVSAACPHASDPDVIRARLCEVDLVVQTWCIVRVVRVLG